MMTGRNETGIFDFNTTSDKYKPVSSFPIKNDNDHAKIRINTGGIIAFNPFVNALPISE